MGELKRVASWLLGSDSGLSSLLKKGGEAASGGGYDFLLCRTAFRRPRRLRRAPRALRARTRPSARLQRCLLCDQHQLLSVPLVDELNLYWYGGLLGR